MKPPFLALFTAGCLAPLLSASAQLLTTFEPPAYTLGNFSTETAINNATTAVGFTGQGGWSRSTSTDGGRIAATTTSGSYVGGQALTTTANGVTYIGAKNLGLTSGYTTFTFNLQVTAATSDTYAGGWTDTNNDSLFTQTETQILGGLVSNAGVISFGFRGAGFVNRITSGVAPTFGDWYRLTVGLNFSATTPTVTLDAFDLTTNTAVDLNGAAAGNQYAPTITTADFGANPNTYKGVVARVSDLGVIDNIAVPEPTTCTLLAAAGLGMVILRRRK